MRLFDRRWYTTRRLYLSLVLDDHKVLSISFPTRWALGRTTGPISHLRILLCQVFLQLCLLGLSLELQLLWRAAFLDHDGLTVLSGLAELSFVTDHFVDVNAVPA